MLNPRRLDGITAPAAAKAANAVSLVAACFCAALLAAGVGPPPFVELGILGGGRLRLVYEVGAKLGLVFHLVAFFASLLVSGVAAHPNPNHRAAAQMLALALWALLGGVWLAAAACAAAAWGTTTRDVAAGVACAVGGGIPLSLAAFLAIMSRSRQ